MISSFVRRLARRARLNWSQLAPVSRSRRAVFDRVYRSSAWAHDAAVDDEFNSGTGSHNDAIVGPYVSAVRQFIRTEWGDAQPVIVDLGCGDFTVGKQLVESCQRYVGVDIVPSLIERNRSRYSNLSVSFQCLDVVSDDLPAGDLCLIRQVLQHLSNDDIAHVLGKLKQYREVLITEHVPSPKMLSRPNRDKKTGPEIRLYWASGVYIDQPPFDISPAKLRPLLTLRGHAVEPNGDPGEIITTRFTPN
jgi:hypothetical protein